MKRLAVAITALCLAAGAAAQALRDPTLPPPGVLAPAAGDAYGDELRLEAIRRLPGKPPLALINGQLLKVGEEIAGRRLLRIGDAEVMLQAGDQKETVRLAPAVEKIMKTNRASRPVARGHTGGGT